MELVNLFSLITVLALPVSLLILALYIWSEHSPKIRALPYAAYTVAIVYEFAQEQMKVGNPIYALEKRALVDLSYEKVLPVRVQGIISREQWAVLVEQVYDKAAKVWEDSAEGLRDSFEEWEAQ